LFRAVKKAREKGGLGGLALCHKGLLGRYGGLGGKRFANLLCAFFWGEGGHNTPSQHDFY